MQGFDRPLGKLHEDGIGLRGMDQGDTGDLCQRSGKLAGAAVGMAGMREQGIVLCCF